VSREAFGGGEFDWFAVDGVGHVGHFATAGFGPVPVPILARLDEGQTDQLWDLRDRVLGLPLVGSAIGHLPGRIDDWLEMARRGLFSYDWKHWSGPYRLAATPSTPIRVSELPPELAESICLIEWPNVRFSESRALQPEELSRCG
jgi:hypothetical protein